MSDVRSASHPEEMVMKGSRQFVRRRRRRRAGRWQPRRRGLGRETPWTRGPERWPERGPPSRSRKSRLSMIAWMRNGGFRYIFAVSFLRLLHFTKNIQQWRGRRGVFSPLQFDIKCIRNDGCIYTLLELPFLFKN